MMQQPPGSFDDPNNSDDLPCQVQIGFLFKRTCGRMDRTGCQYCKGRFLPRRTNTWNRNDDPYFYDRQYYPRYGSYDNYRHSNFTTSDSKSVEVPRDSDFERDLSGS